jgi:hypothetical protein
VGRWDGSQLWLVAAAAFTGSVVTLLWVVPSTRAAAEAISMVIMAVTSVVMAVTSVVALALAKPERGSKATKSSQDKDQS